MIPSPKRVLESWSALIGIWGSSYLALLDALDVEVAALAESMQWPFLIIGAAGTGSVLFSSWRESRRQGRGLDRLARRR
jgi:hypothetical protein